VLPNVVIAGAPKCGTTSLFAWLVAHPEVCGSSVKEPCYLLDPDDPLFKVKSNLRDHGLAGYQSYFEGCEGTGAKVVLEATPVYIYQRTAPQVLAGFDPVPQIVFVFRQPSARAYSHFTFLRDSHARIGADMRFGDFVELVSTGDERVPKYGHAKDVIAHSRYVEYLPAWLERFPPSHLHYFLFEDLQRDPRAFARTVAERLGIDSSFYDSYTFPRKNRTIRIRNQWVHNVRRGIGRRLPASTRKRLKAATAGAYAFVNVDRSPVRRSSEDEQFLAELDREFEPYNKRLADVTGLDLTAWAQASSRPTSAAGRTRPAA
jgi:Sulfotransferase domain